MADTVQQIVGARIRAARERRHWSQRQLADRLELTQTAVAHWESGRRTLGVNDLIGVAQALGIAAHELLPDTQAGPGLAGAVAAHLVENLGRGYDERPAEYDGRLHAALLAAVGLHPLPWDETLRAIAEALGIEGELGRPEVTQP